MFVEGVSERAGERSFALHCFVFVVIDVLLEHMHASTCRTVQRKNFTILLLLLWLYYVMFTCTSIAYDWFCLACAVNSLFLFDVIR